MFTQDSREFIPPPKFPIPTNMDGPDAIDGPDAKKYNSIHVYIVDDPDRNPTQQRGRALTHLVEKPDIHKWSCKVATDFFTKYGSAVIHPVCFPSGTTETAYFQFWTQELGKLTSDDLMIIYYHGEAGGQDEEWSWYVPSYHHRLTALPFVSSTEADGIL